MILEKNNYIVDRVFNGEDGLDYILSNIYNLVILDIMLPKMDGINVLKTVRKERIGTPIILLTAKESGLLELLINRRGIITSKDDIINKLWGYESEAEHNNVEVYVSFIRRKLTHLKSKVIIKAVRNVGYILEYKDGI